MNSLLVDANTNALRTILQHSQLRFTLTQEGDGCDTHRWAIDWEGFDSQRWLEVARKVKWLFQELTIAFLAVRPEPGFMPKRTSLFVGRSCGSMCRGSAIA